jgi:thiol-disulfide isomerase/thioredoxin
LSIKANLRARQRRRRIMWISILAAVAALIVVSYFVAASLSDPYAKYIGLPVDSATMNALTGVSTSTFDAVGAPSGVSPPFNITGPLLTSGGKPEVLYIGGDYCPYCAVERWSLIIALSRFGNFSGLQYMLSSSTDVNKNSPTFTFTNANYTSKYVSFVAVEEWDRSGNVIQTPTTEQSSLMAQYDTCASTGRSGSIPFLDIANQYVLNCGAQFNPSCQPLTPLCISGDNWTQITSHLNDPTNPKTQAMVGAANYLVSAICQVTGGKPSSVCSQTYAQQNLSYSPQAASFQPTLMAVPTRPLE